MSAPGDPLRGIVHGGEIHAVSGHDASFTAKKALLNSLI
jgi:hypothetical protein